MPPHLAANFTTGELASLRIVADEVKAHGSCARTLPEIAARAGVGISTARNAIREASRLGIVTVEERRRHGKPNLANVVRIISVEWLAWLAKGGGGFKKLNPTDKKISTEERKGRSSGWNHAQSYKGCSVSLYTARRFTNRS
jgi:predicted transcriptional regulator